jgi:hypothetical protein
MLKGPGNTVKTSNWKVAGSKSGLVSVTVTQWPYYLPHDHQNGSLVSVYFDNAAPNMLGCLWA